MHTNIIPASIKDGLFLVQLSLGEVDIILKTIGLEKALLRANILIHFLYK